MKVALVIERMDPSRGGRETSTAQIAQALAGLGVDVTILCQQGSWQHHAIDVRQLGAGSGRTFVKNVQSICLSGEFDVTHSMLPIPGVDIYQPRGGTVPAQIDSRLRTINSPFGRVLSRLGRVLNSRRRYQAKLERQLVADASTLCLAGSQMVASEFWTHYKRRQNVRVVFNGVDTPKPGPGESPPSCRANIRRQLGIDDDEPVFLTIATNFPLKGVDFAIRSLVEMRDKVGCGTLIAVGQQTPGRFAELAKSLGVAQALRFVPPQTEIFPWYAAADVCVLLSWYDACSRVVLEACRLGMPSITTVFNGAAEALVNGGGIVVASPADVSAVADAMAELADPEKRQRRSEACLVEAEKLSMARHVDELLEIYTQIAEKK